MINFGRTLRNLGSRASAPAMGKAQAVATGNNTPNRIIRHSGRGSSAGLNAEKTARLELKGTGYSNPNLNRGKLQKKLYPRLGISTNPPLHYGRNKPNVNFDTRKLKTTLKKLNV
jgi:hypothetical protein